MLPSSAVDAAARRANVKKGLISTLDALANPVQGKSQTTIMPDRLQHEILRLVIYEQTLDENSRSRYGCKADAELHHAVCVARKKLQASLLQLGNAIDSLKMLCS